MTREELSSLLVPHSSTLWEGSSGPIQFRMEIVSGYYYMGIKVGRVASFSVGPRATEANILGDTLRMIEGKGPRGLFITPKELREAADWFEKNQLQLSSCKSAFERIGIEFDE